MPSRLRLPGKSEIGDELSLKQKRVVWTFKFKNMIVLKASMLKECLSIRLKKIVRLVACNASAG